MCQGHWKFQNIEGHRCVQVEMQGKIIWAKYLQSLYDCFWVVERMKRDSHMEICCHLKVGSVCQGWDGVRLFAAPMYLMVRDYNVEKN